MGIPRLNSKKSLPAVSKCSLSLIVLQNINEKGGTVFCISLPFKNYFCTMLNTICNEIFQCSSIKLARKTLKSNIYVGTNGIKFHWDLFWNEKWQGASTQNVISPLKPRNLSINSKNVGSLLCSDHYLREVTTTYVQNVVHIVLFLVT